MDLSIRSTLPEELDAANTDPADYQRCRTEVAVINRLTMTHRPTLRWLAQATRGMTEFSVLDVGYGDGDLLRAIAAWACRRAIKVELAGIDLNPRSAKAARDATPLCMRIDYLTGDVFDYTPAAPFDLVVSSQFTHHLTDEDVVKFLRWVEANSVRGWHIADLHRNSVAFYGFQLLGAAMGWHRITVNDGLISIARSFRRQDWESYLNKAGVQADIAWRMGFRFCVSRMKCQNGATGSAGSAQAKMDAMQAAT